LLSIGVSEVGIMLGCLLRLIALEGKWTGRGMNSESLMRDGIVGVNIGIDCPAVCPWNVCLLS
jgi:hypothetical protein